MKKGGGSESTIIIGPSKSVLVYALHNLEKVLGLARFRVFVPKLLLLYKFIDYIRIALKETTSVLFTAFCKIFILTKNAQK